MNSTGTSESRYLRLIGLLKVLVRRSRAMRDISSDAINFESVDMNEESQIDVRS